LGFFFLVPSDQLFMPLHTNCSFFFGIFPQPFFGENFPLFSNYDRGSSSGFPPLLFARRSSKQEVRNDLFILFLHLHCRIPERSGPFLALTVSDPSLDRPGIVDVWRNFPLRIPPPLLTCCFFHHPNFVQEDFSFELKSSHYTRGTFLLV